MIHLECTTLLPVRKTCRKASEDVLHLNEKHGWLKRSDLALEAHRLARFIRKDLLENPDDIQEVSLKIRELRAEVRHIVQRVLERSRKITLKTAELDNSASFEIKRLREILKKKRKTASFIQLRNKIDYQRLSKIFPCWIMSIEDVARVFPLSAGLFDVLIVDEASQCNQAAALHLAYRAKRIIVVGDRKQMKNPNVRFLPGDLVNLLMAKHRLDAHTKAVFFHGREPLLHLADGTRNAEEFLNEHFRCEPPIIGWSNERFYNENLKILTPIRPLRFKPCMEVRLVPGADDDPEDTKQNIIEAKAVIAEVKRLTDSGEAEGLTIGILSLFRQQVTLLQGLLHEEFDERPDILKKHEMIVSTADGFQGDERDIILYSFRYGPSSSPGTIQAMQHDDEDSRGRLNVAFTRARRKAICFVSRPVEQFPRGLIQEFLRHAAMEERSPKDRLGVLAQKEKCQSDFEREIFDRLIQKGLEVYTQVPCSSFYIDFVVIDKEGRRMAVECDGDFHYEEDGDLRPEDYQRQDIIERNGWFVHRIQARRYYANPNKTLDRLLDDLAKQMPDIEIAQRKTTNKEQFKETTSIEETNFEEKPAIQAELPGMIPIRKSETIVKSDLQQRIVDFLMEGPQPIWKLAHKVKSSKEDVQMELKKLQEEGEVKEVYENGVRHWIAV